MRNATNSDVSAQGLDQASRALRIRRRVKTATSATSGWAERLKALIEAQRAERGDLER